MTLALEVDDLLDESGRPRWDELPNDLNCSRCGYNLRMLEQARCPECGLEFAWCEVLDAQLRRHDWLFEHAWRRRPIRSLIVTEWAALRPWSFWPRLSVHDRMHCGSLLALFLMASTVSVTATIGLAVWETASWTMISPGYLWQAGWLRQIAAQQLTFTAAFQIGLLIFLLGLRQTLATRRVRSIQIMRVISYASLPIMLSFPFFFALAIALQSEWIIPASLLLVPAWATTCIAIPLGPRYLRLRQSWLIAGVAVFCAGLFAATVTFAARL